MHIPQSLLKTMKKTKKIAASLNPSLHFAKTLLKISKKIAYPLYSSFHWLSCDGMEYENMLELFYSIQFPTCNQNDPFHTGIVILYDKGMKNYKICTSEHHKKCEILINYESIENHKYYFNFKVSEICKCKKITKVPYTHSLNYGVNEWLTTGSRKTTNTIPLDPFQPKQTFPLKLLTVDHCSTYQSNGCQ